MALPDFFNQFSKKQTKELANGQLSKQISFAPTRLEDTSVVNAGGVTGLSVNFGNTNDTDEKSLIESWRELATRPEVDWAIQEVVNEAIVTDYNDFPVSLNIPESAKLPKNIEKRLGEEFDIILGLMNFNRTSTEKFRQWFIDGKHYYHGIIDPDQPNKGLIGVRWIDPRSIKRVVETEKVKVDGFEVDRVKDTYFLYTDFLSGRGYNVHGTSKAKVAVKVHPDAIAYANSGLFREKSDGTQISISHLDKSLKVANQMKMLEDAVVIYRLARAPERLAFYVDTGNLPEMRAEQLVRDIANKYNNKLTYDAVTGEVKDQRAALSMVENYWLPRREGGRGTEISTIAGGQNLGEMEDVNYFQKKLFKALNIPSTRFSGESSFNIGRSAEITREEVKFSKFVNYLRSKFSETFIQLLKIQVVTKSIMTDEDWDDISSSISFQWKTDSYWDELMNNEIWQTRLGLLQQVDQYVGTYFSRDWVKKNVLLLSDDDQREMQKQIDKEGSEPDDWEGGPVADRGQNFPDYNDRNNDGIPDKPKFIDTGFDDE